MTVQNTDISSYYQESFLSKLVYADDTTLPEIKVGVPLKDTFSGNNYRVIKSVDSTSGYQGYAFQNTTTGEVIISHRGTESAKDWFADAQIGVNAVPDQVKDAIEFNKAVIAQLNTESQTSVDPSTIKQTGHSLGGGIAQIVSVMNNSQAVTFNAPIVGHLLNDLDDEYSSGEFSNVDLDAVKNNIVEIREKDDVVSTIPPYADHLGNVVTVDIPTPIDKYSNNVLLKSLAGALNLGLEIYNAVDSHGMGYMLEYTKSQLENRDLEEQIIDQYYNDVMGILRSSFEENMQQ